MMIIKLADSNLRSMLSNNFSSILWNNKLKLLKNLAFDIKNLHKLGYIHKNIHSENILQISDEEDYYCYILDFVLFGPADEEKSDNKIYGVLPYIATEVLSGKPY